MRSRATTSYDDAQLRRPDGRTVSVTRVLIESEYGHPVRLSFELEGGDDKTMRDIEAAWADSGSLYFSLARTAQSTESARMEELRRRIRDQEGQIEALRALIAQRTLATLPELDDALPEDEDPA